MLNEVFLYDETQSQPLLVWQGSLLSYQEVRKFIQNYFGSMAEFSLKDASGKELNLITGESDEE